MIKFALPSNVAITISFTFAGCWAARQVVMQLRRR